MSLLAFSLPAAAQSGGHAHWVVTFQCQGANTGNPDFSANPNPGAWPATVTPDPSNPGIVEFDETSEIPGGSGALSADSSGSVTPVLTWTPGYAGDTTPPPTTATAIVCSEANASDDHYGWQTPGSVHEENNGQGDPEDNYAYSFFSSGAHVVTQDNSSGSMTVKLTPLTLHAKGTYPSNGNSDTIFVDVSVAVYPIAIDLTGTTPDGNQRDILVGQGCTASLDTAGLDTPSYSWSVTGTKFQDWGPSSPLYPNASYFIGGYGDPTQPTAHWYWNDAKQAPETVTCTATVTPPNGQGSPLNVIVTQKVIVQVPSWSATGTGTYMQVNTKAPQDPEYELWGNMSWDATVTTPTTPAFGQGTLELVQITTPKDSYTTYTQPVQNRSDPFNGITGLDTQYPVSAAIESVPYADGDNPGLPLTSSGSTVAGSAEFQPEFTDYLMYQPPGSDVKWVPIAAFAWYTDGSATVPVSGNWADYVRQNFSDSAGTISPSARTSFKALNTHPSWTRVVTTVAY